MPTFEPPTILQGSSDHFFGRYKIPVGQSVVRINGTFTLHPYPWIGDLQGLNEGTDYFLGGHTYVISQSVADALTTDGFTVG